MPGGEVEGLSMVLEVVVVVEVEVNGFSLFTLNLIC